MNDWGRNNVLVVLAKLISDTSLFFNVQRNMTPSQVAATCELIIKEYYHLSIEDFKHFFDNIKLGKYGTMYESFDGGKILTALAKYDIQRENELTEYRANKNKEHKESIKVMEAISNEQLEKLKEKYTVKEIPKSKPIREKTEEEKILHKYFKEFDLLYKPKPNEAQRFIDYKGKVVSITEYCQIRALEDKLI